MLVTCTMGIVGAAAQGNQNFNRNLHELQTDATAFMNLLKNNGVPGVTGVTVRGGSGLRCSSENGLYDGLCPCGAATLL